MNLKFNDTFITEDEAQTRFNAFCDELSTLQARHGIYVDQYHDEVFLTDVKPYFPVESQLLQLLDENGTFHFFKCKT